MCGLIGFSGNFNNKLLKKSLATLSHRGPDSNGFEYVKNAKVALGHTRLSIIDLSKEGNQPMISNEGNIIIFNGEIYNFKSLKEELLQEGIKFKSETDTEVLLHLYEKYGKDLTKHLNGIFAFAIYDPNLKEIFLTRDNFGIKPLYYFLDEKGIIFGSEIKAIMDFVSFSSKNISKKSIRNHLTYLFNPNDCVIINNLKKLTPGEYLIICNGKIKEKKVWFNLSQRKINFLKPNKSFKKTFINKFQEAVHRQMISDVPIGALLSGGLDSSSIVAFARDLKNDLPCFTIVNESDEKDGFNDDLPYAKRVAKIFNLPLFEVEVKPNDLIDNLYETISILEEPLADPAALNVLFISQIAKSKGIKVLLSGAGGDDVLTGYRRHTAIKLNQYMQYLPVFPFKFIKKLKNINNFSNVKLRRLDKFIENIDLRGDEQIINYFKWTGDETINKLFYDVDNSEFNNDKEMKDFLDLSNNNLSMIEKMLLLEKRFFLTDHNLLYNDKMSMASSIELRVPFLDIDFEEFCSSIPTKFKQKIFNNKWILKKSMEDYLPKDIIYRSKTGFGAPIRKWVRNDLKNFINEILNEENIKKRKLFDFNSIKNLISDNLEYKNDASYTIFSLLCMEIWFQIFIDKKLFNPIPRTVVA